jgi:hypothetical protein
MAAKMNVMKLLQEIRGLAIFSSRRVQSALPVFPSIPWRARSGQPIGPRRKRFIRVDMQQPSMDIPNPVKITHLPASPSAGQPSQTP